MRHLQAARSAKGTPSTRSATPTDERGPRAAAAAVTTWSHRRRTSYDTFARTALRTRYASSWLLAVDRNMCTHRPENQRLALTAVQNMNPDLFLSHVVSSIQPACCQPTLPLSSH
mmetsp:Transcript_11019/g.31301  ORF Transcript_11019/g.31301 Transcript_11019/m.31301 type:complete len:115 (+) Transcript_11019:113-457(+)